MPFIGLRRTAACIITLSSLIAALPATAGQRGGFTLEQIMRVPFITDLVAAPQSRRLAWLCNQEGSRNIWIAENPGASAHEARKLTSYAGDDGIDMGDLAWNAQGTALTYVRGGSLEGGGPTNASSAGDERSVSTIWVITIGGAASKLWAGTKPAFSPADARIAYLADGQLWLGNSTKSAENAPIVRDKGRIQEFVWSPDASRIAFTTDRGGHTFAGVYEIESRLVRWLAPSVDEDESPTWSPDSRRVAFIRRVTGTPRHFFEGRTGAPWSIWVSDAQTGSGHQVWRATAGRGSVFNAGFAPSLLWAADDKLVFRWERSGWLNLYSVGVQGGEAQAIAPGAYEVVNMTLSANRREIIFSANRDDIDRLHLWSASVDGRKLVQLTGGTGIEDYPVVLDDDRLGALSGTARDPFRPVIVEKGRVSRIQAADQAFQNLPLDQLVPPEPVSFHASDGLDLRGQLFKGNARGDQRSPAILFFHGGPTRQMFLGWHPIGSYSRLYAMNQYLANQGYVVLSVNFRGGTGYGLDFRKAENLGLKGSSEANDIQGAAVYLRSRSDVDPARIGIYGGSYGGLMTALGLARFSDLLAAGVDYAGVHDWRAMFPELAAPFTPLTTAQRAYDASPIATAEKWKSPVLFIHADDDRNVPFSQTEAMVAELRAHGVEPEQLVLPNEIHDLLLHASWLQMLRATDEFFARHLEHPR